jgi:hypothetical protein
VWGKPDLRALRQRLITVVTALRADINAGNTRECQAAVEAVGESLLELEESDVPANYVVRLRAEQAGLRKSLLRVYHIQRESFLPSAKAMITTIVGVILACCWSPSWVALSSPSSRSPSSRSSSSTCCGC